MNKLKNKHIATNIYVYVHKIFTKYNIIKDLVDLFPEKSTLNFIDGGEHYIKSLFTE